MSSPERHPDLSKELLGRWKTAHPEAEEHPDSDMLQEEHFALAEQVLSRAAKKYPDMEERIEAVMHFVLTHTPDQFRDPKRSKCARLPLSRGKMTELEPQAGVDEQMKRQRDSLQEWIAYLLAEDPEQSTYPMWFKFDALKCVMEATDQWRSRTPNTFAPYPSLDQGALGRTLEILTALRANTDPKILIAARTFPLAEALPPDYEKSLKNHDILRLYAFEYRNNLEIRRRNAETNEGPFFWKTYATKKMPGEKVHTPEQLVLDLGESGSSWCLAGKQIADKYLKTRAGELHVLFAGPQHVKIGIYRDGKGQFEVRGGIQGQHLKLDARALEEVATYIGKTFKERGHIELIKQKLSDTVTLTEINEGMDNGQFDLLKRKDPPRYRELLLFLYELQDNAGALTPRPIQSFGYGRDPQINVLRQRRDSNIVSDIGVVIGCSEEEIAGNHQDISETTKAYVGVLTQDGKSLPNIFARLPKICTTVYDTDSKDFITHKPLTLGTMPDGKKATPAKLSTAIKDAGMKVGTYIDSMLKNIQVSEKKLERTAVILSVAQLGFRNGATLQQIRDRAKEMGLDFATQETGAQLRLQYQDQPEEEYLVICTEESISDSGGRRGLFSVHCNDGGRWLGYGHGGDPDSRWHAHDSFLFLRK